MMALTMWLMAVAGVLVLLELRHVLRVLRVVLEDMARQRGLVEPPKARRGWF